MKKKRYKNIYIYIYIFAKRYKNRYEKVGKLLGTSGVS